MHHSCVVLIIDVHNIEWDQAGLSELLDAELSPNQTTTSTVGAQDRDRRGEGEDEEGLPTQHSWKQGIEAKVANQPDVSNNNGLGGKQRTKKTENNVSDIHCLTS